MDGCPKGVQRAVRCGARGWVLAAVLCGASLAQAGEGTKNAGQEMLDRAVAQKLSAENFSELGQVIALCDQAIKAGLDEGNAQFANNLLASTAYERAEKLLAALESGPATDPRFAQLRQVALADVELGLDHVPSQPLGLLLRARLDSLAGGDEKRALEDVDKVLELSKEKDDQPANDDMQFEALLVRARLHKDKKLQLADLDEAVKLKPREPLPLRLRGAVRLGFDPPETEAALADFDAAIKLDPKDATTYEARGRVLAMLGKLDDAKASLDKAVELAPELADALLLRAQLNLMKQNFGNALDDTTQALELVPGHPRLLLLRAQATLKLGNPELALGDVDRVLEQQPDSTEALRVRAQVLVEMDKVDDAIADLQKVIKLEPDSQETYFELALIYRKQKDFDKSLAALDTALKAHPDSWFLLSTRADTLLSIGRHKEAVADLEKALGLQANDSGILNNLAWLLATSPEADLRDGKRAVELATRACELTDFKAPHILSTLAAAYAESGDFDNARKWSKKSVELADKAQRDNLKKELDTYLANKPVRERLNEAGEAKSDLKPASDTKPVPPKPPVNSVDDPKEPMKPQTPTDPMDNLNPKVPD